MSLDVVAKSLRREIFKAVRTEYTVVDSRRGILCFFDVGFVNLARFSWRDMLLLNQICICESDLLKIDIIKS